MKRCTRCGVEKPFDDFTRKCTAPDGRRPRCRACESETRRVRPLPAPGHKLCRRCTVEKPLEAFSAHACKADGHRSWCRVCVAEGRDAVGDRARSALRKISTRQQRRLAAALALLHGVKACGTCQVERPLTDFWRRTSSLDGRAEECSSCMEAKRRQPDPEDRARWERWQAEKRIFGMDNETAESGHE